MKKAYINLTVSLAVASILISCCAPEDSANDKKSNTPAVQNEESIKTEQAEENFAVGEEDESTGLLLQNEIENTDGKQNSEKAVTEKEIEDDKQLVGEKYKSNNTVEVSIERVDNSIVNDKGQTIAIIYYDKPVVMGNTKAAYEINDFFNREEEDWLGKGGGRLTWFYDNHFEYFCDGVQGMREQYGDDSVAQSPATYTIDTGIKYLDEDIVSIFQITKFRLEPTSFYYYGSTFNLKTGELIPIADLVEIDADGIRKIIVDATHDSSGYYDELGDENYNASYYDVTFDMRYEYFYDGEYFYIIDNLGGYYRDGVLIRWNGKWGDEYEVTALQYVVDWKSGNWVERILND